MNEFLLDCWHAWEVCFIMLHYRAFVFFLLVIILLVFHKCNALEILITLFCGPTAQFSSLWILHSAPDFHCKSS
jgi:hypothetical protein